MKTRFLSFVAIVFFLTGCQGQNSTAIETIDSKVFADKLKAIQNPQLIDVRTPEEFNGEHIENASNIDWNSDDFVANAEKLDKSKPVFVYCKVGGRSAQAAFKLSQLGFKQVYNLEGGYMKWDVANNTQTSGKIIGMCDQEYNELLKSSHRVMIDFNAKWCAPCQKMKPYILKLQEEMKDHIKIVQLDTDENKTLVKQLKLEGLPVVIVYENGKEVWRNTGYISEEDLRKHL
ncbi:MAG: rhodanese-like domain-containing protein [Flavobacterium sp.]